MWCLAGRLRDALSIVGRVLLLALLVSLSSCVQPTVFPRYLTVTDVINNVKCELYLAIGDAIWENPKSTWLDPWTAKFSIILQVERQTGVNGDFTFVVPYNAPVGLFTVAVGGKADKSGQSRMTFVFKADDNLKDFRSSNQCDYGQQLNSRNNLAGETGLRLWFGNVIDGINQADISKKSTSLTYNLRFVTTLNGHIKPSFKSAYPSKKVFSGAFGIDRTRTDDNQLTIVFSPAAQVFAKTALGKILARIETELSKLKKRQTELANQAKTDKDNNRVLLGRSKLQGFSQLSSTDQVRVKKIEADAKELEDTNERIIELKTNEVQLREDIAAARKRATASTEQQLNNLLLIDAIRDIPRR